MNDKKTQYSKKNGYIPFMGTLSEDQIAKGMEKFRTEVKTTGVKAARLKLKKPSYQFSI